MTARGAPSTEAPARRGPRRSSLFKAQNRQQRREHRHGSQAQGQGCSRHRRNGRHRLRDRARVRGRGRQARHLLHAQEKLDALIPTLGVDEDHVKGFVVDATKEDQVKAFVQGAAEHFGTIDVAIPNAGYEGKVAPIQDVEFSEVEKVYALNVFSPMYVMKYAVPHMLEQKSGAIVVIASAGSYTPAATMSTYCSSKYAVAGLTKCVANEVGPSGVHVNYICPGPVATDMMLRIERDTFGPDMPHEEAEKLMAATALDKRYCKPEEVAYAALYLASEVSAHTTGMPLHLDSIVMG